MQSIAKKILSLQLFVFLILGAILGLAVTNVTTMPSRLMAIMLMALAFPFVAFIVGDVRRFLLALIVFSIPLIIDVNFKHINENQAGSATLGIALRDVFVIMLLLWWIIELATSEEPPFRFFARLTVPAIIYVEVCLLTFLWAPRLDLATLEIVQMVKVVVLFFVVANQIRDRTDLRLVIWVLCATVAFESIISIIQMVTGKSLALGFLGEMQIRNRDMNKLMRAGGTLGHPNRLAMFLEFLLPLVFGTFLLEKKFRNRMIALVIFGLGMASMIITGSRGGWGAMLVSLILFFFLLIRNQHISVRKLLGPVLITLVLGSLMYAVFYNTIQRRLFGEDYGSAISRIPMFQIAAALIEKHPVGGVGINNYAVVMREYNNTILGRRFGTIPRPVHNIYLLITGETGVIGLFAFLLLIVSIVRSLLKTIKSPDIELSIVAISLLSGFAAFLIHGLVDKHPPGGNPLFYFLMAMVAAISVMASHSSGNQSENSPAL